MTNSTPIIIDRLADALSRHGVTLKRQQLLGVAAAAFGYRNDKTFSAAAASGDLHAPRAGVLGVDEHGLAVLNDPVAGEVFAMDVEARAARADRWTITPYGNIVDISSIAGTPVQRAPVRLHMASVSHKHGMNFYADTTEKGLEAQLAGYCEEWWEDARQEDEDLPESTSGMEDADIVSAYFGVMTNEYIDRSSDTIGLPVGTASRLAGAEADAWVAVGIDLESDEPVLWWNESDGWGELENATVHRDARRSPPAAMGDRSVSWQRLPRGDGDNQVPDAGDGRTRIWERDGSEQAALAAAVLTTEGISPAAGVDFRVLNAESSVDPAYTGGRRRRLTMQTAGVYDHGSAVAWSEAVSPELVHAGVQIEVGPDGTRVLFEGDGDLGAAADAASWVRAIRDLLTPAEGRERIMADFRPEAWVRNNAVEVDFEDPKEIDVTYEMLLLGRDAALELGSGDTDHLIEAVRARPRVRNWSGPFTITVHGAIEETTLFGDGDTDA